MKMEETRLMIILKGVIIGLSIAAPVGLTLITEFLLDQQVWIQPVTDPQFG